MGASGWQYTVPFEADTQSALDRLRAAVFADGDYHWSGEGAWDPALGRGRDAPATIEELFADENVREEGTHSILDCPRVVPDLPADFAAWVSMNYHGTIVPVTEAELKAAVGTTRPGAEHLQQLIEKIDEARWVGRAATLYDAEGQPEQIAYWGYSGD